VILLAYGHGGFVNHLTQVWPTSATEGGLTDWENCESRILRLTHLPDVNEIDIKVLDENGQPREFDQKCTSTEARLLYIETMEKKVAESKQKTEVQDQYTQAERNGAVPRTIEGSGYHYLCTE
jgi:hypothetical protein